MTSVLQTRDLTKQFKNTVALDGVTLDVNAGEVFGFLGPNGAGKTTMVRLLLGIIRASSGEARLFGLDPWREAVPLHRRLAYVPGEISLWPQLTGAETLALLSSLHGGVDPHYRDELCEHFELDPSKKCRAYSKGNRQKLGLIAALMTQAELLVLDEPTSGLDPLMEIAFRQLIREAAGRGQTVFLSSHILSEVEALCDRVGILRTGELIDVGTLDEMRHLQARRVEVVFATDAPDLGDVEGVSVVSRDGRRLHLDVRGAMTSLLHALAPLDVVSLDSREPSLEEIFLAHYGGVHEDDER